MSKGTGLGRLYDLIPLVEPIDIDTSQGGDQFSLRDAGGVDLIIFSGVGAAGRDTTFTIKKHVDMADSTGTTIVMGSATALRNYFVKKGTAATAVGVGTWTKSTWFDADGAGVVLDDAEGETSALIVVPIEASDLGDGYSALSISAFVAGGSGAKLACCIGLLRDLQVQRTPANLASALA